MLHFIAIILFEYLLLGPNAKRGPQLFKGLKIPRVHEVETLASSCAYGSRQAEHVYNNALSQCRSKRG